MLQSCDGQVLVKVRTQYSQNTPYDTTDTAEPSASSSTPIRSHMNRGKHVDNQFHERDHHLVYLRGRTHYTSLDLHTY